MCSLDRGCELARGRRGLLVLEDAGPAAHHLRERPEGDAFAVREAAALVPPDVFSQPVDVLVELPGEPRLPDPGHAQHGNEVDLPVVCGVVEQLLDHAELTVAARERWLEGRGPARGPPEPDDAGRPVQLHRGLLALELEGACGLVGDGGVGRPHRRLPDENRARRRDGLDPRGRVDEVARDHPLAFCAEGDGGLAGEDPGACAEVRRALFLAQILHQRGELESCSDGTLRVVLVRDRRTPERHHGVADELLDHAAVSLHTRRLSSK